MCFFPLQWSSQGSSWLFLAVLRSIPWPTYPGEPQHLCGIVELWSWLCSTCPWSKPCAWGGSQRRHSGSHQLRILSPNALNPAGAGRTASRSGLLPCSFHLGLLLHLSISSIYYYSIYYIYIILFIIFSYKPEYLHFLFVPKFKLKGTL